MIRRPPRSTLDRSSAASDVYKRQVHGLEKKEEQNVQLQRELKAVKEKGKSEAGAEFFKSQLALKNKELEETRMTVQILDSEIVDVKASNEALVQELTHKIAFLEAQQHKTKESTEENNQWYAQAMRLKAELDKVKKHVKFLESEKSRVDLEISMLTGHLNANQRIRLLQKIKEENNNYRAENYKLREESKLTRDRLTRVEKDLQFLQSKYKFEDLPSKYEAQIEEQAQREMEVLMELLKLPELSVLTIEESMDPMEQMMQVVKCLVKVLCFIRE
eukprot:TRINITY_DN10370_c0_g5_i1.p1 TRINITY_DN10370_c0_g5~~TRINITY_DN10370_c0_g5_i1.p1  ORF type:complete len:283 (-),score=92.81 TRINITY_DN10370_c0_g5_i1:167-991(-)